MNIEKMKSIKIMVLMKKSNADQDRDHEVETSNLKEYPHVEIEESKAHGKHMDKTFMNTQMNGLRHWRRVWIWPMTL